MGRCPHRPIQQQHTPTDDTTNRRGRRPRRPAHARTHNKQRRTKGHRAQHSQNAHKTHPKITNNIRTHITIVGVGLDRPAIIQPI